IYKTEDLAPGEQIFFAATGVTDGELLHGVRFFGAGTRCSTLFTSAHQHIIRFVDTIHRLDPDMPVLLR
ncbi:MAG: fructose-bisphosphatase class II, partial [Candidatus Rokuibacteriota bacterium]